MRGGERSRHRPTPTLLDHQSRTKGRSTSAHSIAIAIADAGLYPLFVAVHTSSFLHRAVFGRDQVA